MISLKNDSKITLEGKEYNIVFSDKKLLRARVSVENNYIYVYQSDLNSHKHKYILEKYLKDFAKKKIIERTVSLSKKYDFEFNKIAVRDQSSRWGSCSSLKNLNFNWRLIFAPSQVMEYVIIHELCHTVQMNHSRKFWELVESKMPNWREYRNWLRENGGEIEMEK